MMLFKQIKQGKITWVNIMVFMTVTWEFENSLFKGLYHSKLLLKSKKLDLKGKME